MCKKILNLPEDNRHVPDVHMICAQFAHSFNLIKIIFGVPPETSPPSQKGLLDFTRQLRGTSKKSPKFGHQFFGLPIRPQVLKDRPLVNYKLHCQPLPALIRSRSRQTLL
jgi:hypothetical protein